MQLREKEIKQGQSGRRRRVGVMGGTFDPPHYGHLAAAEAAWEDLDLDEVLFIPAGVPPHKKSEEVSAAHHRLAMVKLAVAGHPHFRVSRMELERPGPHYSVDTIRLLTEAQPGEEFYFIIGSDMAFELPRWYEPRQLVALCRIVVLNRPGYSMDELSCHLAGLFAAHPDHLLMHRVPGVDISSTEVRQRLALGKSARYLLPDAVLAYIKENHLYVNKAAGDGSGMCAAAGAGAGATPLRPPAELRAWLEMRMKPARLAHSERVMKAALQLAAVHDPERDPLVVQTSAILHDVARDLSVTELERIISEAGRSLPAKEWRSPALLHAEAGALLVQKELGINDPEVLGAIRYHTTGRPGMTTLEKIIFLADYIEEGRSFPGVEEVRRLAAVDLDKAVLTALEQSIMYIIKTGRPLHPATLEARHHLLAKVKR